MRPLPPAAAPILSTGVAAAILVLVAACTAPPRHAVAAPTPAPAPGLSVRGNRILSDGVEVRLRGIGYGSLEDYDRFARDPSLDFAVMARDWHANVVRLTIAPSMWIKDRDGTLVRIDDTARKALAAGLFPVVDWHPIGMPDGGFERSPWDADAYNSRWSLARDFWDAVSKRIHDPKVVFELWNEPAVLDASGNPAELEPDDPSSSRWGELKLRWQELTAIIRANGAPSLILASANDWSFNLRGVRSNLLPDANTAYTWHVYASKNAPNDVARWTLALDGLDAVRPVVVTEWGFNVRPSDDLYGTPATFGIAFRDQFLERRKLHSMAWSWNPDYEGLALVNSDFTTPTPWGSFIRDYLRSAAGVAETPVPSGKKRLS